MGRGMLLNTNSTYLPEIHLYFFFLQNQVSTKEVVNTYYVHWLNFNELALSVLLVHGKLGWRLAK